MDIQFTGVCTQTEDGGISFQAKVDGKNVPCRVTAEALEDINPAGRFDTAEQQFQNNRSQIENIASQKILNGELVDGRVNILQRDLQRNTH